MVLVCLRVISPPCGETHEAGCNVMGCWFRRDDECIASAIAARLVYELLHADLMFTGNDDVAVWQLI